VTATGRTWRGWGVREGPFGIRLFDVGVVALVIVAIEVNVVTGGGPGAVPLNAWAYLFGALLAVPILFRHRWPLRVLIASAVVRSFYYIFARRNISPAPGVLRPALRRGGGGGVSGLGHRHPRGLHGHRVVRGGGERQARDSRPVGGNSCPRSRSSRSPSCSARWCAAAGRWRRKRPGGSGWRRRNGPAEAGRAVAEERLRIACCRPSASSPAATRCSPA